MAQVINTNVASLNAQRNLNTSQGNLQTSLQRLSSGLRINSAKDDAAGLAISERFTTQIRGLNQAARNASDGISLAQTGEGDLAQVTNNLQRIRELAVQSANATNSSSDRAALQLETAELIAEIERVSSTSAFNGVKLLDGSFSSQLFQVGANAGETVSIANISSARTSAIGQVLTATSTGTAVTAGLTAGDLTINGNDVGTVSQDALAIANAITATDSNISATATNAQTDITFDNVTGVSSSTAQAAVFTATADIPASLDFSTNQVSFNVAVDGGGAQTITLDGSTDGAGTGTATTDEAGFLATINSQLSGATASVVSNKLVITSDTAGASSAIGVSAYDGDVDAGTDVADFVSGANAIGDAGSASVYTSTAADLTVTDYSTDSVSFDVTFDGGSTETVTLDQDYTNEAGVLSAINTQVTAGLTASVVAGKLTFTADANGATTIVVDNYNGDADGSQVVADFASGTETTAGAAASTAATFELTLDGTAVDLTSASTDGTITAGELATAIDSIAGYTASAGTTATQINITKDDGSNFALAQTGTATGGITADTTYYGSVEVTSSNVDELVIAGNAPANAGLSATTETASLGGTTIANTDISSVAGANAAIASVDSALTSINTSRASLGAIQNRFESIVSSIETSVENLSSARSRIRDADFASETATLTRNQILQQAGVSILSQANSLPQLALSLLQ